MEDALKQGPFDEPPVHGVVIVHRANLRSAEERELATADKNKGAVEAAVIAGQTPCSSFFRAYLLIDLEADPDIPAHDHHPHPEAHTGVQPRLLRFPPTLEAPLGYLDAHPTVQPNLEAEE